MENLKSYVITVPFYRAKHVEFTDIQNIVAIEMTNNAKSKEYVVAFDPSTLKPGVPNVFTKYNGEEIMLNPSFIVKVTSGYYVRKVVTAYSNSDYPKYGNTCVTYFLMKTGLNVVMVDDTGVPSEFIDKTEPLHILNQSLYMD